MRTRRRRQWQTTRTADLRVDPPPLFTATRSPARLSIPIGAWPAATPHAAITHHNLLTVSCCMPRGCQPLLSQGDFAGSERPITSSTQHQFLGIPARNFDDLCRPSPDRVLRRTRPAQHPPCLISFPIHTPVLPPVQVTRRPWRGRYISALQPPASSTYISCFVQ